MVDFRSILVERMEYKDSILYLYCKTFYKVLGSDYYNKYDYNVYHRKVLKFKNVKRFEYYLDEQIYNFIIVIDEKEKYLEIKKELLKILQSKKEKFEEKNIKLEVIEDKESSYIINLEKGEKVATLSLRIPNSTRYYYIHYKQNFHRYDWYDEEYHTVSEIAKQLNIILDRF